LLKQNFASSIWAKSDVKSVFPAQNASLQLKLASLSGEGGKSRMTWLGVEPTGGNRCAAAADFLGGKGG